MYLDYYGLKIEPFSITPDPRFLYFTRRHREALDHILYGIQGRKGFIQITGEVGSGKTTLCRALLDRLDPPRYQTALILNPCLTELEMLRSILAELHLPARADEDRLTLLERLNAFLLEQARLDRDVILIIDEAQNMSLELLEQVRMLSNLETDQRKLLQIILVGQPELREKLDDPRLRQLRQRILVRFHLTALSYDEMNEYIQHRLRLSGAARRLQFDRAALRAIFRYTRGTPRLINAVCDKTLLLGYVRQTDRFKGRQVRLAIRELEGHAA
ncbi:MAG: AAA family ATPase [Phycisphaeraceae bacterium]|nr:AAA family ATPase [Phycisphaeraceae bacterium]